MAAAMADASGADRARRARRARGVGALDLVVVASGRQVGGRASVPARTLARKVRPLPAARRRSELIAAVRAGARRGTVNGRAGPDGGRRAGGGEVQLDAWVRQSSPTPPGGGPRRRGASSWPSQARRAADEPVRSGRLRPGGRPAASGPARAGSGRAAATPPRCVAARGRVGWRTAGPGWPAAGSRGVTRRPIPPSSATASSARRRSCVIAALGRPVRRGLPRRTRAVRATGAGSRGRGGAVAAGVRKTIRNSRCSSSAARAEHAADGRRGPRRPRSARDAATARRRGAAR